MDLLLEIIFILNLGVIFYQDMKERKVTAWILISGIFLGGFIHYLHQPQIVFLSNIVVNNCFVIMAFGILWVYAKIKIKKNIFEVFGFGDLLFFILVAVSLPILSFLIVFVFSLIFSLVIYLLLKNKLKDKTVPLAGLQSLFLGLVLIINKLLILNIYVL
ncbi:hypothetical protein [Polaribacter sp. Asnod1-A03]|uniref:hypothetical protein n=1 Tax=Polaribacter sp. Asnod1-A03 TaxID=3160581 RepID=UPI003868D870